VPFCLDDVPHSEPRAKDVPDVSVVNGHAQLTLNGSDKQEAPRGEKEEEEEKGKGGAAEVRHEEIENGKDEPPEAAGAEDSLDETSEAGTEEDKVHA
jgi:hypothetical protein